MRNVFDNHSPIYKRYNDYKNGQENVYYVAVDKNRTWRSIKSGTKKIAQTYICIHGDLRKKSTLELQKANALEKKMSKCPRNVVARRKQIHFQNKV